MDGESHKFLRFVNCDVFDQVIYVVTRRETEGHLNERRADLVPDALLELTRRCSVLIRNELNAKSSELAVDRLKEAPRPLLPTGSINRVRCRPHALGLLVRHRKSPGEFVLQSAIRTAEHLADWVTPPVACAAPRLGTQLLADVCAVPRV